MSVSNKMLKLLGESVFDGKRSEKYADPQVLAKELEDILQTENKLLAKMEPFVQRGLAAAKMVEAAVKEMKNIDDDLRVLTREYRWDSSKMEFDAHLSYLSSSDNLGDEMDDKVSAILYGGRITGPVSTGNSEVYRILEAMNTLLDNTGYKMGQEAKALASEYESDKQHAAEHARMVAKIKALK